MRDRHSAPPPLIDVAPLRRAHAAGRLGEALLRRPASESTGVNHETGQRAGALLYFGVRPKRRVCGNGRIGRAPQRMWERMDKCVSSKKVGGMPPTKV